MLNATITPLTAGAYANGNIPSTSGEQWFTFTATSAIQLIYFNPGTLKEVYVQVYNSSGALAGTRTNLFGTALYTSRMLYTAQEYHIRVTPFSCSGTYQIRFNAEMPSDNVTAISAENTWADGNIATPGGEQWFRFTAAAATQYIHFQPGALNDVNVQLYTAAGAVSGTQTRMYGSTLNTSRTGLTIGSQYYIRVTPYSSGGSGAFRMGFATSTTAPAAITLPGTNVTALSANAWANGIIPASGDEQWFSFTATATAQYIHFQPSALDDVYVQAYDSTGTAVGSQTRLYNSALNASLTLTAGSAYYVRVWPYSGSGSGVYRIGFTESTSPPQ